MFAQLKPGDGLYVTKEEDGVAQVIQMSVLRRESNAVYLSHGHNDTWCSQPLSYGPFTFDEEQGIVYDKDHDPVQWFIADAVQFEKGVAMEAAVQYAAVPRLIDAEIKLDDKILKAVQAQWEQLLAGIACNGEAGDLDTQLALAMDVLGVEYTAEQLGGILLFLQIVQEHNFRSMDIVGALVLCHRASNDA